MLQLLQLLQLCWANGDGKPPQWQEFIGIIFFLLINSVVCLVTNEHVAAMSGRGFKTKVLRNGSVSREDVSTLVPGDMVIVSYGDIFHADVRIFSCDNLVINQPALNGELTTLQKNPSDWVISGSICKQGSCVAVVIINTSPGLYVKKADQAVYQKIFTHVEIFCVCFITVGLLVEVIAMYAIQKRKYRSGIDNLLVLLTGSIPIGLHMF